MIEVNALRTYLEGNLPAYLATLEAMVNVNSFTANAAGVNRLGEMTAELFAPLGFSAERIPSTNLLFGDHLVLTRRGNGSQTVGCVSHLDTVFSEEDERNDDFHWRVEGERIYGPGTNDIKGGTVAIYMMLDGLRTFAPDLFEATTWVLLFDASEERDGRQFGDLCKERLQGARACLVFEADYAAAGRSKILVARKGMALFKITVEGKAAHAGTWHATGANAIVQLADVVRKIADFTDYERELTFNVGRIAGGSVTNRVPHAAEADVEMRCYDKEAFEWGVAQMLALNAFSSVASATDGYACKVTVVKHAEVPPWPQNDATNALYAYWDAAGAEVGITAERSWRGGLSDGNFTWQAIPTLDALGPKGANAHCSQRSADGSKDQEYVLPGSFVPKTLLNVVAVSKMLQDSN